MKVKNPLKSRQNREEYSRRKTAECMRKAPNSTFVESAWATFKTKSKAGVEYTHNQMLLVPHGGSRKA